MKSFWWRKKLKKVFPHNISLYVFFQFFFTGYKYFVVIQMSSFYVFFSLFSTAIACVEMIGLFFHFSHIKSFHFSNFVVVVVVDVNIEWSSSSSSWCLIDWKTIQIIVSYRQEKMEIWNLNSHTQTQRFYAIWVV